MGAALLVRFRALFVGFPCCRFRSRRYLRPSFGQWCSRTSTMSLSRSEEMHRLTENVYKVSHAPRAPAAPSRRPWALGASTGAAAGTQRRPGRGWLGSACPNSSLLPRAPFRASSACAGAGASDPS